jgi:ribulose 1,5-bisphosphate synthetase/thiazole synthase
LGAFGAPKEPKKYLGPMQRISAEMQRFRDDEAVDFCVVGVGAAGGVLLQRLAKAGFKVCGLEAGPF